MIYEVRCPHCRVSFPVGTRRCLHCGGPTRAEGEPAPDLLGASPAHVADDDELADAPRSRLGRSAGLVWVLVALAVSFYRVCSGQS